jgi:lysozyme
MISQRGISLIVQFEGIKTRAYPDPATGAEPWTIGIGHTGNVQPSEVCTDDEAMDWLREDCKAVEQAIDELVEPELTQNQRDALISFVFNVGIGNFRNSTMLKLINASNLGAAAQQFQRWNHAAGQVMPGLTERREAEAALFMEV